MSVRRGLPRCLSTCFLFCGGVGDPDIFVSICSHIRSILLPRYGCGLECFTFVDLKICLKEQHYRIFKTSTIWGLLPRTNCEREMVTQQFKVVSNNSSF